VSPHFAATPKLDLQGYESDSPILITSIVSCLWVYEIKLHRSTRPSQLLQSSDQTSAPIIRSPVELISGQRPSVIGFISRGTMALVLNWWYFNRKKLWLITNETTQIKREGHTVINARGSGLQVLLWDYE
jgi:hypothetical protein